MIPGGYKKLDAWRNTKELSLQLMALGYLGAIFSLPLFILIANGILPKPITDFDSLFGVSLPFYLLVPFIILNQIVVMVPHEGIHGLFAYLFGGKPRFGFILVSKILPGAYTTFDELLPRNKFIIVSLSPLIVLSIVGVILMFLFPAIGPFLIYPLALNAGGAIVDAWLVKQAFRYPSHVLIKDEMSELVVYGTETDISKQTSNKGFLNRYLNMILLAALLAYYFIYFGLSTLLKFFRLN